MSNENEPTPEWDDEKADAIVDAVHEAGASVPVFPVPSLEGFEFKGVRDLGDEYPFILINTGPLILAWSGPEAARSWADALNKSADEVDKLIASRPHKPELNPDGTPKS